MKTKLPSASGYTDELEFNRTQISLGHEGDYDFGIWKSYVSHSETETKGRTLPTAAFEEAEIELNPLIGSDRTLENTDLVADSHLISTFGAHKVTVGAEIKSSPFVTILLNIKAAKMNLRKTSWAIYAEDEWSLLDNLTFTFGTRYEDHSGFGGEFSPRAYLVWNTNGILTIKGGVSTGYKAPSPKALYNGLINMSGQGSTYVFGNSALKPETSTNYATWF